MKKSFNLFPLLLCLPLLHSIAQASPPSQKDFEFLEPFNDTRLVENGLELAGSIAGVSLSTLLNLGIWWGVCETAGIASGLAIRHHIAGQEQTRLEDMKTDFCLQLAPVVTSAEVALAGHVSPWPLERFWWKPLYFAGAGMAAYVAYTDPQTRQLIPASVLTYLASEAVSRTVSSAASASILRKINVTDITTEWYVYGEYHALSLFTGIMTGVVVYETMIHKGFRSAKAIPASAVSAAIAGALSAIFSVFTIDIDNQLKRVAIAGAIAGALAGTVVGVVAPIAATIATTKVAKAGPVVLAGASFAAITGSVAAAAAIIATFAARLTDAAEDIVIAVNGAGTGAAVIATATAAVTASILSTKINSNNPLVNAGVTLAPALTFAVVNSLSNHAVYGDPLEEGLSETARTQWKKFYAPLDYLSTLFH